MQRVICSTSVYPVGQLKVCEVDALAPALYAPSSCAFHATLAHFIYLPQPVARLDLDLALDLCPSACDGCCCLLPKYLNAPQGVA